MPLSERFLKYNLFIFDMDGVITSEDAYFTAAALTVYEMLLRRPDEDAASIHGRRDEIRRLVFPDDRVIVRMKNLAVNTNWDLAFLVYLIARTCGAKFDSEAMWFAYITHFFEVADTPAPQLYDLCAEIYADRTGNPPEFRLGPLWLQMQERFQAWYLGDALFERLNGHPAAGLPEKPGLIHAEKPIVPLPALVDFFDTCQSSGIGLGAATGRPYAEIEGALKAFGVFDRFDPNHFATYQDIVFAEETVRARSGHADFSKPHPFLYLRAALGKSFPLDPLLEGAFDPSLLRPVLGVGDALSDLRSAKDGGMDFAAVLTGISGQSGRRSFQKAGADYILGSVLDFSSDTVC